MVGGMYHKMPFILMECIIGYHQDWQSLSLSISKVGRIMQIGRMYPSIIKVNRMFHEVSTMLEVHVSSILEVSSMLEEYIEIEIFIDMHVDAWKKEL